MHADSVVGVEQVKARWESKNKLAATRGRVNATMTLTVPDVTWKSHDNTDSKHPFASQNPT
jgi:hypothetical protein